MSVTGHLMGGPGELVAVDLPPGEHWLDVLGDLWWRGVSIMPIDHRLPAGEKRALIELGRPAVVVMPDGPTVFAEPSPADPVRAAAVVATSGTGGRPRLAELPRAALETSLSSSNTALGADTDDPWLAVLNPAHIGGLLVYLRAAALGTPVAAHPRFEPEALDGTGSALASVVPTMVGWLVQARARLAGVTLLVGGGDLDPELRGSAEGLGARVVTTYGLTETCGGISYDGMPLPGVRVRLDPDGGIEVHGPTLMEGYRHDGASTAAAFSLDGWLRTGDVGAHDPDGRLIIRGRADDQIRTGGEKVWPDEVERVLVDHPKVREAGVAGLTDADWGQLVAAWVVPEDLDQPPTIDELREHCRERLARFKAPRALFLVHELPRTATGKLRRRALIP